MDIDDQSCGKKHPSHQDNIDNEKIFHSNHSKEEEKVPDPKNIPNKKHPKRKKSLAQSRSSSDHDEGRIRPRNPMSKVKEKQVQSELPVRKELNKYKHIKKDL